MPELVRTAENWETIATITAPPGFYAEILRSDGYTFVPVVMFLHQVSWSTRDSYLYDDGTIRVVDAPHPGDTPEVRHIAASVDRQGEVFPVDEFDGFSCIQHESTIEVSQVDICDTYYATD